MVLNRFTDIEVSDQTKGIGNNEKEKKHIVIVDDEPVNLELAENALKDKYKITKLKSGAQLLKFLIRFKPDLILLDILMPEMDGFEVVEKIMSDSSYIKDIPIIFLTGREDPESEEKGYKLGAKDFIKKPFNKSSMPENIEKHLL